MGIIKNIANFVVKKAIPYVTAEQAATLGFPMYSKRSTEGRGIKVYTLSELMGIQAKTSDGEMQYVTYERPLFGLSIDERIDIMRLCSPVFGVVTSRMNRIAGLEWIVVPDSKNEDKIVHELKYYKSICDDFKNTDDLKYRTVRGVLLKKILNRLPDVLPDLSNFDRALIRWRRMIKSNKQTKADQIEDWLYEPNINDKWSDFIKQFVFDLMVHGAAAIYKEILDGKVENLYTLPGGTIIPVRSEYVGGVGAYVQIVETMVPQLYFGNEVVFANYVPTSARSYGMVPLDSLVNKVSESLLFDRLMAEQADGTKVPEKLVVFGDVSPFGDISSDFKMGMDPEKQNRIETLVNESRKGAIKVLSGVGQPMIFDLTRENTMSVQMERQRMIREEVALVYNMSNLEINMSDSEGVSGRSTSESLQTIDQNKSVIPMVNIIQDKFNLEIIPFRFGIGYSLEFQVSSDKTEELNYRKLMLDSGLYSTNEIRTEEMSLDPFDGEEYNKPAKGAGGGNSSGGGMADLLGGMGGGQG